MTHARKQLGFTLIELMIAVTVMGVLIAIALPTYQEYSERSRRADAKAALLRAAQWLERASTATGAYPVMTAAQFTATGLDISEARHYVLTLNPSTATAFTLTATPAVIADTRCGNMTLTNTGVKGRTGTGMTAVECWNR